MVDTFVLHFVKSIDQPHGVETFLDVSSTDLLFVSKIATGLYKQFQPHFS